jgi:DNA-binding LacI/PurR family transcriptional regulator
MMTRAVTAIDVAREAGVSQATVSYVINNHPSHKIAPETRERVLKAVERLGYTPSAAARALRRGSSDIVLLVLPDVPYGPAVSDLVEHLIDELERYGLELVTRRLRPSTGNAAPWRELRPAAVVCAISPLSSLEEAEIHAAGIPLVGILLTPTSEADSTAQIQELVGRLQVEHLAATGHSLIGYAAPDDERVSAFFRLRLEGVRLACLELGIGEPVIIPIPLDARAAARAVSRWRSRSEPVTAVCAYNDEVAFAVLAGMHRLGLTAPRDLAVIGVDNIPLAPLANPPLTTVDQHIAQMARHLAHRVASAVRGEAPPRRPRSDSIGLVIRESA